MAAIISDSSFPLLEEFISDMSVFSRAGKNIFLSVSTGRRQNFSVRICQPPPPIGKISALKAPRGYILVFRNICASKYDKSQHFRDCSSPATIKSLVRPCPYCIGQIIRMWLSCSTPHYKSFDGTKFGTPIPNKHPFSARRVRFPPLFVLY